jgi:hypothetical protein
MSSAFRRCASTLIESACVQLQLEGGVSNVSVPERVDAIRLYAVDSSMLDVDTSTPLLETAPLPQAAWSCWARRSALWHSLLASPASKAQRLALASCVRYPFDPAIDGTGEDWQNCVAC